MPFLYVLFFPHYIYIFMEIILIVGVVVTIIKVMSFLYIIFDKKLNCTFNIFTMQVMVPIY